MPPRPVTKKPSNPPPSDPETATAMADPPLQEAAEDPVAEEEQEPEEEEQEEEEVEEEIEEEIEEEVEEEIEEEEEGGGEEEAKEVPEPVKEKRKQREFEVFVGGLPRDATEDDIEKVFKKVGEVVQVRLVKNPISNKNKGFAFVRFATVEQAKRAATDLKRTQVKGKSCGVIRSNDNETLHLGNICTTWTKDDLMEKLKSFELENLEDVHLIEDPNNKGRNRGYAFLDFSTHMDAVTACSKLQKRDVFFGTDVRAEVSFSKTVEPDEEVMAQVKSVFLDGLPAKWDEAQVCEHFKKFGEIESVQLARNMPTAKRKDFGFICFATRQAALDCIEKVNKDGVGEGAEKVLVKATLKRPLQKRIPPTLGLRRGYVGKSFGMRRLQPYESGRAFLGRPARSRELMSRPRGLDRFSSRGVGVRAAISSPSGKFGARPRREFVRDIPGPGRISSRSREPYMQSSSTGRRSVGSYRDLPSTYSHPRGRYADDIYDTRIEHYDETYEYPAVSGYKRSYSEIDHDVLPSSSVTRRGKSRSGMEMDDYPQIGGSAYDEYSRGFLPDERLDYDRMNLAGREYGSRYLAGSGASRSYY